MKENEITDNRIREYKMIGCIELNIEEVIKKWNKNTCITQWHDRYRLIEFKRKDSPITKLKVSISEIQAKELIKKLNLKEEKSAIYNNASTWRCNNAK